jgi:cytochrome c biogenesis protein CcmG, thiol:disulfide interchange protein DsbE
MSRVSSAGVKVPRKRAISTLAAALIVLAVGCGGSEPKSAASETDFARQLSGSPPRLAALHRQADELLGGGRAAFRKRLEGLRGYPVVVNKWASWCSPCRSELPLFQRQSLKYGKRVAFLGVDSNDSRAAAKRFQAEFPVPYPSYFDPKLEVAGSFDAVQEFPATAYYDRRGKLAYVRRGVYPDAPTLEADIRRYAR